MSAGLVLTVAGLVEGSIKLVRKIKTTCQAYRNADKDVNEKYVLVESLWVKIEMQLKFLGKISGQLTNDLVQSQLDLLQTLKGKSAQAVSRLEVVNLNNVSRKRKAVDVLRKWKYTLVKSCLNELITELEAWLQRSDLTWFLIILVTDKILDAALSELTKNNNESTPLTRMLAIRSTLKLDISGKRDSHVTLPHNGLKGAAEYAIAFTAARGVKRAGSSDLLIVDLLIVERISCPPGTTSQIKIDVKHLVEKLQNVDPDSFGLLRCKGILKHYDSTNRLSAIEVVYRTSSDCQLPQTLRYHLLQQNPVSLSTVMQIAKHLVRSVHYIHTCGFVHKNIRPENLLVFPGSNDSFLGRSFLIGFTEFRNANFQTNLLGDAAWHRNLYRHPQRQGTLIHERYIMQHDIYSLGVCLLEIGLWRSFVWYPTHDDDAIPVPGMAFEFSCSDKDFEGEADIYTDIVVTCMSCLNPDNETFGMKEGMTDEDGVIIGVRFVEHILSAILVNNQILPGGGRHIEVDLA